MTVHSLENEPGNLVADQQLSMASLRLRHGVHSCSMEHLLPLGLELIDYPCLFILEGSIGQLKALREPEGRLNSDMPIDRIVRP